MNLKVLVYQKIKRLFFLDEKEQLLNEGLNKILAEIELIEEKLKRIQRINENLEDISKSDMYKIGSHFDSLERKIADLNINEQKLFSELQKNLLFNFELKNLEYSINKKHILLIGFYGANNLGDELMLETILTYFEKFQNINITVMVCDSRSYSIHKYNNINFIHYPNSTYDIDKLVRLCDAIVFAGGAIIDDRFYRKQDLDFRDLGSLFIEFSNRAIKLGKELYCLGLSTNVTLTNLSFILNLGEIINKANYFSLRDKNSFKTIEKKGIEIKKIKYLNDLVLSNKQLVPQKKKNKHRYKIGIIFICNKNTEKRIKDMLEKIITSNNSLNEPYKITLIPFYQYENNDKEYYDKMINKDLQFRDVKVADPPQNMQELIEIFEKNGLIISMRYHASLIGLALNIPTLTICYNLHVHYPNKIYYLKELFGAKIIDYSKVRNLNWRKEIQLTKEINSSDKILKFSQKKMNLVISKLVERK